MVESSPRDDLDDPTALWLTQNSNTPIYKRLYATKRAYIVTVTVIEAFHRRSHQSICGQWY